MTLRFYKPFIRQEPIPEAGICAAVQVLRSGALHRYGWPEGESPAAILERRFACWQDVQFCLAVTSGGQAMRIALMALGIGSGDPVLTNAWTLAPVPGAIATVGARPVFVETTEDLVIDLDDLQAKAAQTGARVLLLSHMRGHVVDMEKLMAWADAAGVAVIEDCAHTMGATWNGCKIGNFGKVACFSCQTYKHLNAGEGGFVTTQDPDVAARATILSGSYMLFDRHGAGPNAAAYGTARYEMPNSSARMDNLRAAILIPQVDDLDRSLARWMNRARIVNQALMTAPGIVLPISSPHGQRVGSSIQWRLPHFDAAGCERFVARCADRGVEVKWFGASAPAGFTSAHASWRFVAPQALPRTDRILSTLFDMRLPLTFSRSDCLTLGRIIVEVANDIQEAVV